MEDQYLERGFSVLVLAIAVHALVFLLWKISKRSVDSEEEARFPRGPKGWPIVGNLPLLLSLPHQQLAELYLKKGYGAIIGLRLGTRRAVVVSDAARAREILLTHDKAFANRVPLTFINEIFYGPERSVIFGAHTHRWMQLRKVCTLQLLTTKRLYEMREARYSEGRRLLRRLCDRSGTIVELGSLIAEMNAAAMARLILSKTLDEVAPEMPQIMRSVQSNATPTIGDFIPYLSFTDAIFKIGMKRLHRRLNAALDSILEERSHLISRLPADQLPDDFLQVLLSAKTDDSEKSTLTPADIKAIMSDLFLAGIDTSASTLEWAMAELIRKKECLQNLQKELDEAHKGKADYLTDEDVKDLPYLHNVVKEVLRLHPVVPLLIPRISSTETTVEGYLLPRGTIAFVNVWAIARDPKIWDRPEDFCPERFETNTWDMKGQDYELLPFGSGRRMCLGIRLGMSMVTVTLANLIRFFDWEPALGKGVESIHMGEENGLGSGMEHPLKCTPHIRKEFVNAFLT